MYFRSLRKTAGDVSLSDSIDSDREGEALSLMDVLCDDGDMLAELEDGETALRLRRYLEALEPRERRIIVMRYGMGGKPALTQREIADACGISRSYVSRIEKKALRTLRACFDQDGG